MRARAVLLATLMGVVSSLASSVAPSLAFAAQPSEFSPTPNPAPPSQAKPPPAEPAVPPKPAPAAPPDMSTGATPPVADALPPTTKTGSNVAPQAPDPEEPPPDPAIEAIADDPHLAVGAGGHVAFGTAPAVAVGARVSFEIATGRWSLGVEGRYDLPAGAPTTQGGSARTSLVGGSFVPCFRAKGTWACGVVMASRMSVDGTDASGVSASDRWFFFGIGARLEMHLSLPLNFALRIGGELLAHPIPYELTANGHRIFKSSVVSTIIGPSLVRAF